MVRPYLLRAKSFVTKGLRMAENIDPIRPYALAGQGKIRHAAASLAGGNLGEAGSRIIGRATKTVQKARRLGLNKPRQIISAGVRGATTGLVKNRRMIAEGLTGGSLLPGQLANHLVKKSPLGQTRVGKLLTKDISAPIYNKLGIRKKLRASTNGLFNNYSNLVYY